MLILRGVPPLGDVKQRWGGKQAILKLNASISRKLSEIRPKLLLTTNGKLHMRFRLIPRSMTLNCISSNFSGFRRFGTQQQLNVSDSVVTTTECTFQYYVPCVRTRTAVARLP